MADERVLPTPADINAAVRAGFPGGGNECVEIGARYAVARRIPADADIRPGGFISGPTQFSVADGAMWFSVFGALGRIDLMALTSELSIRFLRPCIGDVLWARATVDAAGRRNIVSTIRVWTDDDESKPSAVAQGTYAVPQSGQDSLRP
jgi:acyl-coenzyme A thioesterase PaaI-like protein